MLFHAVQIKHPSLKTSTVDKEALQFKRVAVIFFSVVEQNDEKLASGGVFCWCLLSMSWSCRERCTGKMVHYGREEGGKWQKGGREEDL